MSSSVQCGLILVQFGTIRSNLDYSVLFTPIWSYSVQFSSIFSNLVIFGPSQSILSTLVQFGPRWSYYVQFSSIQSNLVIFGQLCLYSVQFGHIRSNLVICGQLCFYSVQFSHIRSYSVGRILRLHAATSSRSFHILFDGLNDALSKIYLQPYLTHRSCPSHLANKRIQDSFPSKLWKPNLRFQTSTASTKTTYRDSHMSLSWVINLILSAKQHMKACLGIIGEFHTILHESTTGCFDLLASEFSAQMNVPDYLMHFNLNVN